MAQERDDVVRSIHDRGIEFIHLWFTDVLGFLKSFTIDSEELETAMGEGMGFDGSCGKNAEPRQPMASGMSRMRMTVRYFPPFMIP